MSKLLPMVRKIACPVAGAVQVYQTELSAGLTRSPCEGSSGSAVAPVFRPLIELLALGRNCALTKLSFAGASAAAARVDGPLAPLAIAVAGGVGAGPGSPPSLAAAVPTPNANNGRAAVMVRM